VCVCVDANFQVHRAYSQKRAYEFDRFMGSFLVTLHVREGNEYEISTNFYWNKEKGNDLVGNKDFETDLLRIQAFSSFVFTGGLVVTSVSFLYRHTSIFRSNILQQRFWGISAFVALALQLCLTFMVTDEAFSGLNEYYWILLLLPPSIIVVDEVVKRHDSKLFTIFQKRARLMFDTLLGMHSPK